MPSFFNFHNSSHCKKARLRFRWNMQPSTDKTRAVLDEKINVVVLLQGERVEELPEVDDGRDRIGSEEATDHQEQSSRCDANAFRVARLQAVGAETSKFFCDGHDRAKVGWNINS